MERNKARLQDFRCNASGVMVSESSGTPAGYRDGAERYLFSVLQNSRDLGIFSRELKAAVKDWPSLYHLSPNRTTILDCLGLRGGTARVLELGAGCGALTRWLGETFNPVSSVEGNYQRAEIARLRCRDLASVTVYHANVLDLDVKEDFDIATLIGVLEYSHLYHPLLRNDPEGAARSLLKMVFKALADPGVLVIALENRLGLKYFSGAREDHSGRIFDGIQGYPSIHSAVTFSAAGLERMILEAGFSSASFYLPFPDYKLASTIIKGDRPSGEHFLHNWIETPFPDRSDSARTLLYNESLVMRELSHAGLLRDMANSFLIVAVKGAKSAAENTFFSGGGDWIARHYSLGRHAAFQKVATLREIRSGEPVIENSSPRERKEPAPWKDSPFTHRLTREPWCRGDQLTYRIFEMLASDRFETDFITIVRTLNTFLIDQFSTGEHDAEGIPLLKGEALDVLFWNIIVADGTEEWVVIDREWSYERGIPVDFVLWRNLHHLLMRYHRYIDDNISDQMRHDFIFAILRAVYPAFNEDRYACAKRMDDQFQDYAHHGTGGNSDELNRPDERASVTGLVSIIIPVFNKAEYTRNCLESLAMNTSYHPYEVIIVDNGSTDGTKDVLREIQGDIRIVTNEENLGFARACNQGARASRGEYLVFLNNDTVPQPGWLENLVKSMKGHDDVGVVGCKLLYPDNRVQHAGVVFANREEGMSIYHLYRGISHDHPAVNYTREFKAVTAACMLVKKSVFVDTGMFDEGFINGYEDVDFCLRTGQRGLKILYTPESVLYHHEETTEGRRSHGEHNTRYFLEKWGGRITADDREKAREDGFRIQYHSGGVQLIPVSEVGGSSTAEKAGAGPRLKTAVPGRKKKIAIVRGANLNKWEMQNYEPLMGTYNITAYTTTGHTYDTRMVNIPVRELPYTSQGLLLEMKGLEEQLAGMDLIFSADITYRFSAQAVRAKQLYGGRVICLEWENVPFNYEEHVQARAVKETVRSGADHFIAVTERAKEALMLEGVPSGKIDVVPMGVDLTVFRPENRYVDSDRGQLGIGRNDTVFLFIGRMVWEKGIHDYIHAASVLMRNSDAKDRNVKFLVVGRGPELHNVQKRAAELALGEAVIFREEYPYDEIYRLYNLCDIFVLPSIPLRTWQEQFGMVLIESMACGKPVISTLSGSIPEVVGDAGILVQPNDHLSLYGAMKQLTEESGLRKNMGQRSLARARALFDSRKTAEKIRDVFEKVLSIRSNGMSGVTSRFTGLKSNERGCTEDEFTQLLEDFERDPDRKEVLDTIVQHGMALKRHEAVVRALREYLSLHPASLDALLSLAEALFLTGKMDDARDELKKVFLFDEGNEAALALMEKTNSEKVRAILAESH